MLDKIYTDFTTKLLPEISKGLSITKDYFIELFGRYIKYLIIENTIWMTIGIILIIIGTWLLYIGNKWYKEEQDKSRYDKTDAYIPIFFMAITCYVIGIIMFFTNLDLLIQDIYIPEIRIVNLLQDHITK